MLVNAILGFLLGYTFVALLPYVWLGLKVLWEFVTSVVGLFQAVYELIRCGVQPAPNKPIVNTPSQL